MAREDLLQDLAYARTLAEEGRHAPLLGGAHLLFWGVLNATAFTAHWAMREGLLGLGDWGFALIWAIYGVIAGCGIVWLRVRVRDKPGLSAIGARAEAAIWLGAGAAIMAVVAGSLGRLVLDGDPTAPNAIFGAAFALYGAALMAVSRMAEQGWMRGFGGLSLLIAALLCLFANQSWAYLLAAAGSVLVLVAPGFVLLRREPSAVV